MDLSKIRTIKGQYKKIVSSIWSEIDYFNFVNRKDATLIALCSDSKESRTKNENYINGLKENAKFKDAIRIITSKKQYAPEIRTEWLLIAKY